MPQSPAEIDVEIWKHIANELGEFYTGTTLTQIFNNSGLEDVHWEGYTKRERIEDAIRAEIVTNNSLDTVFRFIEECIKPVRFIGNQTSWEYLAGTISEALMHAGYIVDSSGKIVELHEKHAESGEDKLTIGSFAIHPIWGAPDLEPHPDECFILMPFNDELTRVYTDLVKPAIEETGMSAKRADDIHGNLAVMQDVWDSICSAGIVIADLTGRNPNVFYELGIAHTVGRTTILIAQEEEHSIPFDIRHIRQIQYENTAVGGAKLVRELKATIVEVRRRATKRAGK